MLREFESPAYMRIVFFLGVAIVGMAIMVVKFSDSTPLQGQLLSWLH